MKYTYIIIFIVLLLLAGCASKEPIGQKEQEKIIPPAEQPQEKIEEQPVEQPKKEEKIEQPQAQEPSLEQEKTSSEENPLNQLLNYSKTRLISYSYQYKSPSGPQYTIYVKGNKIRIDSISSGNTIYIDTEKKTAEEYCISHPRCGRQTGKIANLDYSSAYIDTPIDWLAKITQAKKIDEHFYAGKKSIKLDTNIGEVIIDSHFGFIYSIKKEDKTYSFTEASFNVVKDSDVTIPEYLLPGNIG